MRRRILRLSLLAIALLAVVLGGLGAWASSDHARHRFEHLASQALGREVRFRALDVGWGALTLHDLTLADPWSEAPALSVEQARFELELGALLSGGLVGTLQAEHFTLDVRKRGETTNLHGMRRPRSSGRPLDVGLRLVGGDVRLIDEDLGAQVRLEDVAIAGCVRRADAQPVVTLDVRAGWVRGHGVAVHDVSAAVGLDADRARLSALRLRIGEAVVEGWAEVGFEAPHPWSASVTARDLGIHDALLPIVVAVFPAAVGVESSAEADMAGALSLSAEVRGEGLSVSRATQSAQGHLRLRLRDVTLPQEAAAVRVASLFGRPAAPLALPPLDIEASLHGPWVVVDRVRSGEEPVALPFSGRVALDGRLDVELDVLPLLQLIPGAHPRARTLAGQASVRIRGTVDAPDLQPPSIGSVVRAMGQAWVEGRARSPKSAW